MKKTRVPVSGMVSVKTVLATGVPLCTMVIGGAFALFQHLNASERDRSKSLQAELSSCIAERDKTNAILVDVRREYDDYKNSDRRSEARLALIAELDQALPAIDAGIHKLEERSSFSWQTAARHRVGCESNALPEISCPGAAEAKAIAASIDKQIQIEQGRRRTIEERIAQLGEGIR